MLFTEIKYLKLIFFFPGKATRSASTSLQMGDAVAIIKGGKNLRRKEKKARIEQIRASLGLSDSQRTPMVRCALQLVQN